MSHNSDTLFPRPIEILLIEDDLADIKLTQRELKKYRILNNIHVARDGVEAMEYLHRQGGNANAVRPDMILLDLDLPHKDGRQILSEIKQDAGLKSIPVIVLTTSDAQEDILNSSMHLANSSIIKPVEIDQFRKAILSITDYWFSVVHIPV